MFLVMRLPTVILILQIGSAVRNTEFNLSVGRTISVL